MSKTVYRTALAGSSETKRIVPDLLLETSIAPPFRGRFAAAMLLAFLIASPTLFAEPIEIGHKISLRSASLGEDRSLLIYLPESYDTSSFRYPVLYLLDAEWEFVHSAGVVEFLAGAGQIPEMILVGVANTERSRDLTPPSANEEETAFWPAVGGADRFRSFLRDELIPFIDEEYRTVPYRVLRGQSFGGLLAIHDAMSGNHLFNAYLTSSPAVGWNFGVLIDRAPDFFSKGVPQPIYVAAAGRDFPQNLANIKRFAEVMDKRGHDRQWQFDLFPTEGHASLVHLSTYRALKFLYDGWEVSPEVAAGARFEDYESHYAELSIRYGYAIEIPLLTVIRLGNQLLRDQRFADGIRVLEQNLTLYPEQPKSHWHVGDGYALSDQPEKALPHFKKALLLAESTKDPDVEDYRQSLSELKTKLKDTSPEH